MSNEHKNTPKTIPEIGIHIGYIHEELSEIKSMLKEVPSRTEFKALENDHNSLKKRHEDYVEKADNLFVTKKELKTGYMVITVILAVAISIWTIIDKIRGV